MRQTLSQQLLDLLRAEGLCPEHEGEEAPDLDDTQARRLISLATEFYEQRGDALHSEAEASREGFSLLPDSFSSGHVPTEDILAQALYADTVLVPDPFVELNTDLTGSVSMGPGANLARDVVGACKRFGALAPLVDAGVVRFLPVELLVDRAVKLHDRPLGVDIIEPDLVAYARARVEVFNGQLMPDGSVAVGGRDTFPAGRVIHLQFGEEMPGYIYCYAPPETVSVQRVEGGALLTHKIPLDAEALQRPVAAAERDAWVDQCRQAVVRIRLVRALELCALAEAFGSAPVTGSPATFGILELASQGKLVRSHESRFGAFVSELSLPSAIGLSAEDIASLRGNDEAFAALRKQLREFSRQVHAMPASAEFKRQAAEIRDDTVLPAIAALDKRAAQLRTRHGIDALFTSTAVALAACAGGIHLAAPALALTKWFYDAYKAKQDFEQAPLWMLWNARRLPPRPTKLQRRQSGPGPGPSRRRR